MKKLLLILLCLPLLFTTCKKEENNYYVSNIVYGCTDTTAFNYLPAATNDDGNCCYIAGCTDSTATNYNPTACYDDGSCLTIIYGCTDPLAINYNSAATLDDGSCLYQCTDPYATNFLVTTSYLVCEYESDVVFYLDVPAAQEFTNLGIPFLDVYVVNDLAGSMPTNVGFTSTVTCTDTDPEPVHFTYLWEDAQSTTLSWTVRDGTGFIWYDAVDIIIANNCLSLQLTWNMIKEYQDTH